MKIRLVSGIVCVCVALFTVGCGSQGSFNVPKLTPCSIKLTKGGAPLADATVILVSDSVDPSLSIGGSSDAQGIVNIRTLRSTFQGNGAPEGTYKVTVMKVTEVKDTKTQEEIDNMSPPQKEAYSKEMAAKIAALKPEVPNILGDAATTTLTATVSAAGGEILAVDVDSVK